MPGKGKPFVKGEAPGKPKGAETLVKKEARALFLSIMEGQVDNIEEALESVRIKDPAKYIELLSKLFPYFMPKHIDITSGGDQIKQVVKIGNTTISFD